MFDLPPIVRGGLGILMLIGVAWALSSHKKRFPVKIVFWAVVLQVGLALLVLKTEFGRAFFDGIGAIVTTILAGCDAGAAFVFGPLAGKSDTFSYIQWPAVAGIKIMSTIIVFSMLSAIGYHYGILQRVVAGMAYVLTRLLRVSGAESLSCAGNVFLGQTEAPLLIRPYLPTMTRSELMAVMTGGFATIAMGVMAVYVNFLGIDDSGMPNDDTKKQVARHLLTASLMSAPAAFAMAKVMIPETETPKTLGTAKVELQLETQNGLDAATHGASQGMILAINVIAMLIAFIALIEVVNIGLARLGALESIQPMVESWGMRKLSLQGLLGVVFSPVAYFIGVQWDELHKFGSLLGTAMATNEFIAYLSLSDMLKANATGDVANGISHRSATLAMYSLCGFANVCSIGIQIAGIGVLAPSRRGDLVRLAPRAMLGGAMASWMTGCIAGMLTDL